MDSGNWSGKKSEMVKVCMSTEPENFSKYKLAQQQPSVDKEPKNGYRNNENIRTVRFNSAVLYTISD
jgi:hypothetical protein